MRRVTKALVWMGLALLVCSTLHAQDEPEKINANMGFSVNVPLNPTAQFSSIGWGVDLGTGYNFTDHHSFIGEFVYNWLSLSGSALQPIREAAQNNGISGNSNLYAITGNYRYQLQGKTLGAYVIGGGGWYYRTVALSQSVTSGTGTVCTPAWLFYGFTCVSGTVTANQTIKSYNSSAIGGNVGVGFTYKVGEPSYRAYIESRYHYAPTKNVNTQLIDITVGIRY